MEELKEDPFPDSHEQMAELVNIHNSGEVNWNWSELDRPLTEDELGQFFDDGVVKIIREG